MKKNPIIINKEYFIFKFCKLWKLFLKFIIIFILKLQIIKKKGKFVLLIVLQNTIFYIK